GIGNIFKSEVCFVAGVNPFRVVKSLSDEEMAKLMETAVRLLRANIREASGGQIVTYHGLRQDKPEDGWWVYHRPGLPCRKCGTPIERRKDAADALSSFWCPVCQPASQ